MKRILKIAAVDDSKESRDCLAEKIDAYMQAEELNYRLFTYVSGEAFLTALENERFHIVFMDIFMEGITGLDAAAALRKGDMDCKLVFLTTSGDFWKNGYSYNCCHYIMKEQEDALIPQEAFLQAMANCRIERQLEVPFLDVISEGISMRINTEDLIYVDICDRNAMLHMTDKILPVRRGFPVISARLLTDHRFIQCIRGVIINMDFIEEMGENDFLLKNGERLPFASRDRKGLEKIHLLYTITRAEERICKK